MREEIVSEIRDLLNSESDKGFLLERLVTLVERRENELVAVFEDKMDALSSKYEAEMTKGFEEAFEIITNLKQGYTGYPSKSVYATPCPPSLSPHPFSKSK